METNSDIIILPVVKRRPWVNTDKYGKNKILGASTTLQPYVGLSGLKTGLEGNLELQTKFEKELSLKAGTLEPITSNDYWFDLNIKLEDGPNIFYRGNPSDMLKVLILRNHPLVAESEDSITPESEFYIVDKMLEGEKKASKFEKTEKAFLLISEMSTSEKRQFAKLFGTGGPDMSDADVKTALGEEITNDVDNFLRKAEFSKERINITAFIFDLVTYNILRIRGNHYFDSDEDKGDLETLIGYFLSPEKQEIFLNYKERLEYAKKGK